MGDSLKRLYNTMLTIETKGESTKTMCDCLRFVENLIVSEQNKETENATEESYLGGWHYEENEHERMGKSSWNSCY